MKTSRVGIARCGYGIQMGHYSSGVYPPPYTRLSYVCPAYLYDWREIAIRQVISSSARARDFNLPAGSPREGYRKRPARGLLTRRAKRMSVARQLSTISDLERGAREPGLAHTPQDRRRPRHEPFGATEGAVIRACKALTSQDWRYEFAGAVCARTFALVRLGIFNLARQIR